MSREGEGGNWKRGRDEDESSPGEGIPSNRLVLEAMSILRSIDSRLERLERHVMSQRHVGQRLEREPAAPPIVVGSWKFDSPTAFAKHQVCWRDETVSKHHMEERKCFVTGYGTTVASKDIPQVELLESSANEVSRSSVSAASSGHASLAEATSSSVSPVIGNSLCSQIFPIYEYVVLTSRTDQVRHDPSTPSPPPWWYTQKSRLPKLLFNDGALLQKSGIYSLSLRFNKTGGMTRHTVDYRSAIIIGNIEFNMDGYVTAEGADWEKLMCGQRQTSLPYSFGARGIPHWRSQKISEPWVDGDVLKFTIDVNENTIVFQKGNMPKKALCNVLCFTNNRMDPDFVHLHAYSFAYIRDSPYYLRDHLYWSQEQAEVAMSHYNVAQKEITLTVIVAA